MVDDLPGVTRDRQYGISRVGRTPCLLVDTGGLVSQAEGIDYLTAKQVHQAIDEAESVLFVVSALNSFVHSLLIPSTSPVSSHSSVPVARTASQRASVAND